MTDKDDEYQVMMCKPVTKKKSEDHTNTRNYKVLAQAASQIGTLEWKDGSNPQVEEYLDYGSRKDNEDSGLGDHIPWCAGFVAWCCEKVGMGSTNSLMARSYEKWGISSKSAPLPGDIVTFYRNGLRSGQGHVGFFLGWQRTGQVLVLGGNQSDAVNVTSYSHGRMTDIRRSSKAGVYTKDEVQAIRDLAEKILSGEKVQPAGSVV